MILRSFWIDGDLDFTNEISRFQDRFPDLTFPKSEITGLPYTHYGVGNAILWTPFFAVAHGYVKFNHALGGGIPADGFSSPYITLVSFASAFYAFLGLVFLYLTLRQYFSLAANLTATLLIWFATPLLYYMYLSPTVSHANSFFSVTLFLFVWHKTRKARTAKGWILLGLLSALVFLVRQEDSVVFIVPAIESLMVYARKLPRIDMTLLKNNVLYLLALVVGVLPQFIFFNHVYGYWSVTGAQLKQHAFDPSNLFHAYKIFIAQDHGLFLWIPVSLLGIIGWYFLAKKEKTMAIGALATLILFVLFTASVKQWMALGSFSARHFIGILSIFGWGIAALFAHLERRVPRPYLFCITGLFIAWNLNIIVQYGSGLLGLQDPMHLPTVLHNTIYELPQRIITIAKDFLFNRGSFIRP